MPLSSKCSKVHLCPATVRKEGQLGWKAEIQSKVVHVTTTELPMPVLDWSIDKQFPNTFRSSEGVLNTVVQKRLLCSGAIFIFYRTPSDEVEGEGEENFSPRLAKDLSNINQ